MNELISIARNFVRSDLPQEFSETETRVIDKFFTNSRGRVFLIHTLPENMIASLLAMYSRIKNTRGLRGIFVDNFLPQVLATLVHECDEQFAGSPTEFLKVRGITNLDEFVAHSPDTRRVFEDFCQNFSTDLEYLTRLADSRKVRDFLRMWLEQYGHNSIARIGFVHVCFEGVSILAAKSVEWCRPGAGYMELSTRYVDMAGKGMYPIENELATFGISPALITDLTDWHFAQYRLIQGENFTGPLPEFLRQSYRGIVPEEGFEMGIMGETCDVLGNLLPCSTLVSVGASISGEALPVLIKHLKMDNTPENHALVELILEETKKIGADHFIHGLENIATWQENGWNYLRPDAKNEYEAVPQSQAASTLWRTFAAMENFADCGSWAEVVAKLNQVPRGPYDKLPREFEGVSFSLIGQMSFRGWRDLHRMGMCGHRRSYVTPEVGFYEYDKPAPDVVHATFREALAKNRELYQKMMAAGVPKAMAQYPMALGNLVKFWMAGNLRQMEFAIWQRSKPAANHEVRQVFLSCERHLRNDYPWWKDVSRADITPAYVFARGSKVPLASVPNPLPTAE